MTYVREDAIKVTQHALARMSQRGYTTRDLELIRNFGTAVHDGYLLTRKDVLESDINVQRLEKLVGTYVVEQDAYVVTIYRPDKRRLRRTFNHELRRTTNRRIKVVKHPEGGRP